MEEWQISSLHLFKYVEKSDRGTTIAPQLLFPCHFFLLQNSFNPLTFIAMLKVPGDFSHDQLRLLLINIDHILEKFLRRHAFQYLDLFSVPEEKDLAIFRRAIRKHFFSESALFVRLTHHVTYSFAHGVD